LVSGVIVSSLFAASLERFLECISVVEVDEDALREVDAEGGLGEEEGSMWRGREWRGLEAHFN